MECYKLNSDYHQNCHGIVFHPDSEESERLFSYTVTSFIVIKEMLDLVSSHVCDTTPLSPSSISSIELSRSPCHKYDKHGLIKVKDFMLSFWNIKLFDLFKFQLIIYIQTSLSVQTESVFTMS